MFNYIEGCVSENLTTKILHFILDSPEHTIFQRIFYQHIFNFLNFKDTEQFLFEVTPQHNIDKYGRPDIVIDSPEYHIVIENKFYAFFTDKQIFNYYSYLRTNVKKKQRYLIILTLRDQKPYYLREIINQFNSEGREVRNEEELDKVIYNDGIIFKFVFWEDILEHFGKSDFIVKHLNAYITDKFLTSAILTKGELEMINMDEIPQLMEKLWAGIDKIRDAIPETYQTKNLGQSRKFYGFYIEDFWGSIWIGFWFDGWKKFNTPYLIQLKKEWITIPIQSTVLDNKIKKAGLFVDRDFGYVRPILIQQENIVTSSIPTVLEVLSVLHDELALK